MKQKYPDAAVRDRGRVEHAMTKDEWERFVEKNGHPPTWQPHEMLNHKVLED